MDYELLDGISPKKKEEKTRMKIGFDVKSNTISMRVSDLASFARPHPTPDCAGFFPAADVRTENDRWNVPVFTTRTVGQYSCWTRIVFGK